MDSTKLLAARLSFGILFFLAVALSFGYDIWVLFIPHALAGLVAFLIWRSSLRKFSILDTAVLTVFALFGLLILFIFALWPREKVETVM